MMALKSLKQGYENIRKLYFTILILAVAVLFQTALNLYFISICSNLKPLVIRVSEAGKAEAISMKTASSPASDAEIKYLAKEISETIFGFSKITYQEDLKRIIPYVSYSLKSELLRQYQKLVSFYLNKNREVRIEVFAVLILSRSNKKIMVRVDYVKKIPTTGEGDKYYSILTFKPGRRSINNPFGLLLLQIQEHRYLKQ